MHVRHGGVPSTQSMVLAYLLTHLLDELLVKNLLVKLLWHAGDIAWSTHGNLGANGAIISIVC